MKKCECGRPLPMHLVELFDSKSKHVCACERAYKAVDGKFVADGTEVNPFARYDAAQAKGKRR